MTGPDLLRPDAALVDRFGGDLDSLVEPEARVGIAVSGGPDSLALLLLAAAARPGRVEAATVDHGFRPESRAEAEMVAGLCQRLGVPHAILTIEWQELPSANLQAIARRARYDELGLWALGRQVRAVCTAHHADDQAETLLMRLARGSGVAGLAGARPRIPLAMGGEDGEHQVYLVRPVRTWSRTTLAEVVHSAGIAAVADPSNADERYDRTRARALLASNSWLDPARLAAVADHCADADDALRWLARREYSARSSSDGRAVDASDLPYELQRRLLAEAIEMLTRERPPGPELIRALDILLAGGTTTLAGLKLRGGEPWRLQPAPPRRPTRPAKSSSE
jgi:tRNA(Ile)-lysidine synthase